MYIEPNSIIRILKNIPLDTTYEHTIYFGSSSAQSSYFSGKAKYTLNSQSYQRVHRGIMRVQLQSENLYDCNYIMFQNSAFGSKWFYAFIKGVEYVNNVTSEISFEIDVMQTWMFDYTLKQCFVEREHVMDDTIGANTVPENVELGPYVTTSSRSGGESNSKVYCLSTEDFEITPVLSNPLTWSKPSVVQKRVNSMFYIDCGYDGQESTANNIESIINSANTAGKAECLIFYAQPVLAEQPLSEYTFVELAKITMHNNYLPKNNKLYTYPYTSLALVSCGQTEILRYEHFDDPTSPKAALQTSFGCASKITVAPYNYESEDYPLQYQISISGFPVLPWASNYYLNYIAQHKSQLTSTYVSAGVSAIAGVTGGLMNSNMFSATTSLANAGMSVASTLAQLNDYKVIPDNLHGSANAPDTNYANDKLRLYSLCRTIKEEYMKIIDDYFSKFGYAIHRLKVPNISGRPQWNYVKTIGCVISGSMPCDDERKICSIYDNGITFWKNPANVGNYSLDNSI